MRKNVTVLVRGPALSASGYGEHCRFLIRSLMKTGMCQIYIDNIRWGNLGFDLSYYDEIPGLQNIINETRQVLSNGFTGFDITVQVTIPNEFKKIAPYNVGVTAGIETDRVSKEWIEKCNEMDKIITISEHSENTLKNTVYESEEGKLSLQTPISTVPYPVLDSGSVPLDLNLETDFNFLVMSLMGTRKNMENTIRWFIEEFMQDDVGLVLKTSYRNGTPKDKHHTEKFLKNILKDYKDRKCKVYLLHGRLTDQEKNSLYNHEKIKCLVNLAHGEGFGLPIFEAAYNGLPIIAPNWSGHLDFLTHEIEDKKGKLKKKGLFSKVDYELGEVPASAVWDGVIPPGSRWSYPKKNSYKTKMREVYKNYGTRKSVAEKLKEKVLEKYEYEKMHNKFSDEVFGEKYSQTSIEALPKISIITSVYDGDDYIEQFMENMTSQTIFESHCELILVNANSPGNEQDVISKYVEKYPGNIKVVDLPDDPGIYAVWNLAVEMSTGEYITNANLDDRRRNDCIELQAKALYNNPNFGMVYNDNYETREPNILHDSPKIGRRYVTGPTCEFEDLLRGNPPHNSPMWRKSIHEEYGNFDTTLRSCGDWEMWLRATSKGMKIRKMHIPLGVYYFNPKGMSTNLENQQWKQAEEKRVYEKYIPLLGE